MRANVTYDPYYQSGDREHLEVDDVTSPYTTETRKKFPKFNPIRTCVGF